MMHKLISLDHAATIHTSALDASHHTMTSLDSHTLGATTLSLITYTLQFNHQTADASHIQLKQVFRHWMHMLEHTIVSTQIQKALQISMQTWIDLKTSIKSCQISRTQKAGTLLRHLSNCISVFNLGQNKQAIKVLHYLLLHPICHLPKDLMQQQADLHALVASYHHKIVKRPNYQSITNSLLINTSSDKQQTRALGLFMLGLGIGFVINNMIQFNFFRMCLS